MKVFFNLIKVFSVIALVTSCAYENDPGLKAKITAKTDENDVLANKTSAAILKAKYSKLSMQCTLVSGDAVNPMDSEATDGDAAAVVPPKDVFKNENEKTTIDFLAQLDVDKDLSKVITGPLMKVTVDGVEFNVALSIDKLNFLKNSSKLEIGKDKDGKDIKNFYVMKYSPEITGKFVLTKSTTTNIPGDFKEATAINEAIGGSFYAAPKLDGKSFKVSCALTTELNKDTKGLEDQLVKVNCLQDPATLTKDAEKKAFAQGCKPKAADDEQK